MRKVNMHEAKSSLSELVRLAMQGEDIVFARNGVPVARLIPFEDAAGLRPVGLHILPSQEVTDAFVEESLRPMSREELDLWDTKLFPDDSST
ncbi:MAG: type II toxin-antitoxin system prevent-host-death family antitoxin [Trueperaceae bacterium]